MTRKLIRNYSLSVAAPFVAILILCVGLGARAEMAGRGQQSAQLAVASTQAAVALQGPKAHFAKAVAYDSGGTWSYSVAVGDVNGDGHPDIVVANNDDGSVGVLLGNGDGTFQLAVTYSSGGGIFVALGDVNGDGHPDIVAANNYGSVGVLLGNGDGSFQPALTYGSSGAAWSVALGDVNGDGKLDVVVANASADSVGVLLGNGDGSFQPPVSYSSGGAALSVALGDVNGDGHPDLVVANSVSSSVGVLLGNGDGSFQPPIIYSSGGYLATSVAIGDVNGDGKPDLVVSNFECQYPPCNGGIVSILVGNGDGTFQLSASYGSGGFYSYSVVLADVNGDGKPDMVTANLHGHKINNGVAGVLLNEFAAKTTVAVTSSLNPSFVNQPVTFTATSTPPVPDGQIVTFYDGTTAMASVALVGGTAAYSTSFLSGTHSIKAKYPGDVFFKPGTGSVTQVVLKYPTTTALTSSPNPSAYGQRVTFTATVAPGGPYTPTGRVKFLDGTTGIGSALLSGGVAALTKSTLAVGTHAITAQYLGDAASAQSTSSVLDQVVQ